MQTKKIRIKKETYDRLTKKGKFRETIDDIINRILDGIEKEDTKTMQMTNTIMNLKTTKKHELVHYKVN
jgi:frataxin-like iron-binding protein CyaY